MLAKIWYLFFSTIFVLWISAAEAQDVNQLYDCSKNSNCQMLAFHMHPAAYDTVKMVSQEEFADQMSDIITDAAFEAKARRLKSVTKDTLLYQYVLAPIFGLDLIDSGSHMLMDADIDNIYVLAEYVESGGKIYGIYPFIIPIGGDFRILMRLNIRDRLEGRLRMGLGGLSAVSGLGVLKALGGATVLGVRLAWVKWGMRAIETEGGRISAEAALALSDDIARMGEAKLAAQVARTTRLKTIEDCINLAIGKNFLKVGSWAGIQVASKVWGYSLPARPSSLAPAELARFAITQGALVFVGETDNLTTKTIRRGAEFTGVRALGLLHRMANKWIERNPKGTTQQFIEQTFKIVHEFRQPVPAQQVQSMTQDEVLSRIRIVSDQNSGELTITSL